MLDLLSEKWLKGDNVLMQNFAKENVNIERAGTLVNQLVSDDCLEEIGCNRCSLCTGSQRRMFSF